MKKFFAFVAAALVAFSFASCDKGGGKDGNFKIAIGDVEATAAEVAVTPSDENAYYYLAVYDNSLFETYTYEDAFANFKEEMEYYVENYGVTIDDLVEYGYVEKGAVDYNYSGLSPEKEYIVLVAQIDENFNMVGDFVTKTFTTPKTEKTGEKTITLTEGVCDDHCADYGWWQLMIADADTTVYLSISPLEATQLAGTWTIDDMDGEYTFIYDLEVGATKSAFVTFNATTTAENGIFHLTGKGLASNGIEYTLDLTGEVTTSNDAPAAAPKKARIAKNVMTLQAAEHVAVKSLKK